VKITLKEEIFKSIQNRYSYGLDGRGSIPGRAKKFFLYSTASRLWGPFSLLCNVYRVLKRPGREVDRSLSSSAEVKIGGAIPSLAHTSSWYNA
jgi:hypothetical protein